MKQELSHYYTKYTSTKYWYIWGAIVGLLLLRLLTPAYLGTVIQESSNTSFDNTYILLSADKMAEKKISPQEAHSAIASVFNVPSEYTLSSREFLFPASYSPFSSLTQLGYLPINQSVTLGDIASFQHTPPYASYAKGYYDPSENTWRQSHWEHVYAYTLSPLLSRWWYEYQNPDVNWIWIHSPLLWWWQWMIIIAIGMAWIVKILPSSSVVSSQRFKVAGISITGAYRPYMPKWWESKINHIKNIPSLSRTLFVLCIIGSIAIATGFFISPFPQLITLYGEEHSKREYIESLAYELIGSIKSPIIIETNNNTAIITVLKPIEELPEKISIFQASHPSIGIVYNTSSFGLPLFISIQSSSLAEAKETVKKMDAAGIFSSLFLQKNTNKYTQLSPNFSAMRDKKVANSEVQKALELIKTSMLQNTVFLGLEYNKGNDLSGIFIKNANQEMIPLDEVLISSRIEDETIPQTIIASLHSWQNIGTWISYGWIWKSTPLLSVQTIAFIASVLLWLILAMYFCIWMAWVGIKKKK